MLFHKLKHLQIMHKLEDVLELDQHIMSMLSQLVNYHMESRCAIDYDTK